MDFDKGYLKVILGPMFSGKTTELIRIYSRFNSCDIGCCVINHSSDKRYDNSKMSSHNKVMIESLNIDNLMNILPNLSESIKVYIINEGQFFQDLKEGVEFLLSKKKTIYVCGLDGDFQRKKFGSILDIIPLCDDIVKLKGICNVCKKNESIFTHRKGDDTKQILIGEKDLYMTLCRDCYDHLNF